MRTAIVNLGRIVSGDWREPWVAGDAILMDNGVITQAGQVADSELLSCDVVIDAGGATAIPGLIDSQVHNTFGDYTPRQKTVGFLESYVHGGVTTAISASEVHVPGRPKDPEGVKALAVAAMKCFETYRPGGMRVWAGAVILEPGLLEQDFADIARQGVWLAKAGFGAVKTPYEYTPMIAAAKKHGMTTLVHTGGSSIPGSSGMGNLRTTLWLGKLVREADQFDRFLIATDTPTGSGIMPLGLMYTISHLASLGDMPVEMAIAAATGNNARVYKRNSGFIAPGRDADVVIIDACVGGSKNDALASLTNGDIAAVAAVVTDGVPRFVGRSRNTPAPLKTVRVAQNRVPHDFSGTAH